MPRPDMSEQDRHALTRTRLAAIVRSSADPIIGETLDGFITDWNSAAERLYGYTAQEVIGQHLSMLVPPEERATLAQDVARVRGGESIEGLEAVRWTKDGRRLDVVLTISPVYDDAGQIVAASAIVRDISAAKAHERALAESEERFRVAFQDAPAGIAVTTPDSRILHVNRAVCAMLGYSADELLATTLQAITHPDDGAATRSLVDQALAGEITTYAQEKRYIHKDGHVIWALLNGSLVRDEAGAPRYFISHIQNITERKVAEAELALTHQNTRHVLERITDGFYALDREWRFTYVNHTVEWIMGRTRDELLGQNHWEVFGPEISAQFFAPFQRAMTEGVTVDVKLHSAPTDRWFEGRVYPSPDGLSVFFHDVSEAVRTQEALRRNEARFRSLIANATDLVTILSADGSILYESPPIERILGYDRDELVGRNAFALVHPEDRPATRAEFERALTDPGLARTVEFRCQHKDGSWRWLEATGTNLLTDPNVEGFVVNSRDITERKRADEALRAAREAWQRSFDALPDHLCVLDRSGAILQANQTMRDRFEPIHGSLIGLDYRLVYCGTAMPVPPPLCAAVLMGGPAVAVEITLPTLKGDYLVASFPIDIDGERSGAVSVVRDITERKRVERELESALEAAHAANRAKNLFLAMMSHELRTPMQAVLGYADLLLAGGDGSLSPEQIDDVQTIRRGAERMTALVSQMLDLSRLEAGRMQLVAGPIDLRTIIAQVRQEIAPLAAAKGLELTISYAPDLVPVIGDAVGVEQILLNLAGNAIKFTEQGSVRITAATRDDAVVVTVSDTGIGIPTDALPHIFEEFRQVERGMTRRHEGAGLGLAIAKLLAEQMGGCIQVESFPGDGSSFTLHLPALPTDRVNSG